MITISLDRDIARSGEEVSGHAAWSSDGRPPKAVTIALRWYTEGRGNQDRAVAAEMEVDLEGPAAGLTSTAFRLRTPKDGPLSYDGMMIRVRWEVAVELSIPWGKDETETAELWVLPL